MHNTAHNVETDQPNKNGLDAVNSNNTAGQETWLVIDTSGPGGIETHILQLALALQAAAVNIRVVVLQPLGNQPLALELDHYNLKTAALKNAGTSFYSALRAHRPALVHAHGYKASILSRLFCLALNIPQLSTFHSGEKCQGKLALYDFIDRKLAFWGPVNLAVSHEIKRRVSGNCQQINNFVSTEKLPPSEGDQIAFVGRLSHEKGPDTYIEIAKRCGKDINLSKKMFHIYGDGPLKSTLEKGAPENSKFNGHTKMEDAWHNIGVLIISSRHEGLPLAAIEAMARGVIVIAFNVGQLGTLIQHNKNGFLCEPDKPEQIVACLNNIELASKGHIDTLKKNARLTIEAKYSSNALTPVYLNLYKKLTHKKGATEAATQIKPSLPTATLTSETINPQKKDYTNPTILFVHYGDEWIRGSEVCLIQLCNALKETQFQSLVWTNSTTLANALRNNNINCKVSKFSILVGWKRPQFQVIQFIKQITQAIILLKNSKIACIHTNNGAPNQWMIPAAKLCRTPVLTQLHANYLLRDRLSLLLNFPDVIVGVSRAVLAPFTQSKLSAKKCECIYNGIDIENKRHIATADIREQLKLPKNSLVIVSVGSLIKRKGMDIILRATKILTDQGVSIELIIAGDGEERDALASLANSLNIQQYTHFLGEYQQVPELLRSGCDVFVSAARDEAFGLVLAEAGFASLPCIATRVGGIPEVVVHEKTGLLVDSENAEDLAFALHKLAAHPNLRRTLGENAYHHCVKHFSLAANTGRLCELYETLIYRKTNNIKSSHISHTIEQVTTKRAQPNIRENSI